MVRWRWREWQWGLGSCLECKIVWKSLCGRGWCSIPGGLRVCTVYETRAHRERQDGKMRGNLSGLKGVKREERDMGRSSKGV